MKKVLIVGGGTAGTMILQELKAAPALGLEPIGVLDDDEALDGANVDGVPVVGRLIDLPRMVRRHSVEQVIIAMPSVKGDEIRRVVQMCREVGVSSKTVPGIFDIVNGSASVRQLNDVDIDDLLRREPIRTNTEEVGALLRGSTVMVTGAGGSIGSELCRQIASFRPSKLLLIGHGENSIFQINQELARKGFDAVPIIADIRHAARINLLFDQYRPDVVFHAAAHKHVGLMEQNQMECVTNNIQGTANLLEAVERYPVKRFVAVSSDKAVNPTSIMGLTKRVAELNVQAAARRTGLPLCVVRFGNVLGSRGSVVPIFKQQIQRGGPVTVSHPDCTRFFMTIMEAVQLVLQAAVIGQGGEIFVLDMGEPIKIVDLATDLIRLSGMETAIEYVGLKSGEKLHEELFYADERPEPSRHPKIRVTCASNG